MSTANPAVATETLFFGKELFSNTWLINGRPAPFEQLDGNHGVLAIANTPENKPLIDGLNDAATHQRGGIYKMSKEQYDKKKAERPLLTTSQRKRPDMLQMRVSAVAPIFKQQTNEASPVAPVAAAEDKGGFIPTEVPQPAKIINTSQPATVEAPAAPPEQTKATFKPTTARASQKIKSAEAAATQ